MAETRPGQARGPGHGRWNLNARHQPTGPRGQICRTGSHSCYSPCACLPCAAPLRRPLVPPHFAAPFRGLSLPSVASSFIAVLSRPLSRSFIALFRELSARSFSAIVWRLLSRSFTATFPRRRSRLSAPRSLQAAATALCSAHRKKMYRKVKGFKRAVYVDLNQDVRGRERSAEGNGEPQRETESRIEKRRAAERERVRDDVKGAAERCRKRETVQDERDTTKHGIRRTAHGEEMRKAETRKRERNHDRGCTQGEAFLSSI